MGKNVAVFVDVANIFYAAKAAGVDIDYVTLLKSAVATRDFVRAYAYTGLDPENENQRNFHAFLARNGYKVVSKDIRKYGDGKVKANLDIELVVDMMKTARNLDVAIVVSGDGDFAPAIRAVQEMGVRVEVISFKGNTSSDLIDVADLFTDITHLAKVEKGSRSGRRVAEGDEDLSMTEVPEKQSEGTGRGRARGRGRGRTDEPIAARGTGRVGRESRAPRNGREPLRDLAREGAREIVHGTGAPALGASTPAGSALVALPGEKLSKAAERVDEAEMPEEAAAVNEVETLEGEAEAEGDGRRRRRRRGGRGRGRGRGHEEGTLPGAQALEGEESEEQKPEYAASAPQAPRGTAFGSFWDSQIGMPTRPSAVSPASEEEYEDEPEIPEYLIAEQRRGQAGRGGRGQGGVNRAGRGRGGAYAAAIERERYGRGSGGGINRYPDVSGRTGQGGGRPPRREEFRRDERGAPRVERPVERATASRNPDEPWSEVPPEIAQMLLAQVGRRAKPQGSAPRAETPAVEVPTGAPSSGAAAGAADVAGKPSRGRGRPRGAGRTSAEGAAVQAPAESAAAPAATAEAAPKRRGRPKAATTPAAEAAQATATPRASDAAGSPTGDGSPAAEPTRRATRGRPKAAVAAAPAAASTVTPSETVVEPVAARRRTPRAKAVAADGQPPEGPTGSQPAEPTGPATRRRATRRTTAGEA
ncbi:MAG TPA: NYN domain-containing protein [Candidatus Limnocylindrales bacterium]